MSKSAKRFILLVMMSLNLGTAIMMWAEDHPFWIVANLVCVGAIGFALREYKKEGENDDRANS